MTTSSISQNLCLILVVEAYRLGKYDNSVDLLAAVVKQVVEAYRLGKYDNFEL